MLNANPYKFGANIPKPKYRQNQYGGSLGGPIIKDKTFFFADYEGLNIVRNLNPTTTTVPTLFERNNPGNFTDNPAINKIVPQRASTRSACSTSTCFRCRPTTRSSRAITSARRETRNSTRRLMAASIIASATATSSTFATPTTPSTPLSAASSRSSTPPRAQSIRAAT